MIYKGFNIDYSSRDYLYIISFQINQNINEIVGHALSIAEAHKMIDFHVNIEFAKREADVDFKYP